MAKKSIVSVGVELPSDDVTYIQFDSRTSLLDWDIIIFRPDLGGLGFSYDEYQGRPCLDDRQSVQLREACEHWRREIREAFDAGKTVIVYLAPVEEVYIATGERSFSGTGRNRITTRHVAPYDNYRSIPARLNPNPSSGSAMKMAPNGAEFLAPYWGEFGDQSMYQVRLVEPQGRACVLTKTGDHPVGVVIHSKSGSGTILMLPDLNLHAAELVEERDGEEYWSSEAEDFGRRLIRSTVDLDKALRSQMAKTPVPEWATSPAYVLTSEAKLRSELLLAERAVEHARKKRDALHDDVAEASRLRSLLFEKGKPLEVAIIEGLRILGFAAVPFREGDSEFDVVFECDEGRLLGEAEGKDNKAVNIEKLRQLSLNINEDLQREEINEPAKPVLFGNGFRLKPLAERPDPFTEKCKSASRQTSTALVFTPDLFAAVQHVVETNDQEFSRHCRRVLLGTVGRVVFPEIPQEAKKKIETIADEEE